MKDNHASPLLYFGTVTVVFLIGIFLLLGIFMNREERFRNVIAEGNFIIPAKGEGFKMLEGLKEAMDIINSDGR